MIEAQAREEQVLDFLQRRYEADGFSFIRHPTGQSLPDFLRHTQPDALAIGANQNIVIEVKASRRMRDRGTLAQMARLFENRRDWLFKIVYADDLTSTDDVLPIYGKEAIHKESVEVRRLLEAGSVRAGFVLAWGLLESVVRRLGDGGFQRAPKSANSIAEFLEREGLVSMEEARWLWEMASVRNAVVHGDLDREVHARDVEHLTSIAENLNAAT
jgi:hypothetical protein